MLARIPKRADQHAQSFTKQCSESFYLDGRPLRNKTFPFWCHGGQVIGPEELVVESTKLRVEFDEPSSNSRKRSCDITEEVPSIKKDIEIDPVRLWVRQPRLH